MAASITHKFVNPKADSADTTIVRPSDWNDDHDFTGLQETLVSGTNIKTINGSSVLGSGDLSVSGGHTIQDEGTPLTQRTALNFVGTGVTVTDDGGNDATVVTITAGGGAVDSVNGQTGTVSLDAEDVQAIPLDNRVYPALPYTVTGNDRWLAINVQPTAENGAIYLDTSDMSSGIPYFISNADAAVNLIIDAENGPSGGTINGAGTLSIPPYAWVELINNSGDVRVVAANLNSLVYGALPDAASDGKTYGRKNGAWSEVVSGGGTWGSITGTLSSQTDLQNALDAKLAITSLKIPFYKANGSLDTIALTSDSKIPFYKAAGTASNIPLTT